MEPKLSTQTYTLSNNAVQPTNYQIKAPKHKRDPVDRSPVAHSNELEAKIMHKKESYI